MYGGGQIVYHYATKTLIEAYSKEGDSSEIRDVNGEILMDIPKGITPERYLLDIVMIHEDDIKPKEDRCRAINKMNPLLPVYNPNKTKVSDIRFTFHYNRSKWYEDKIKDVLFEIHKSNEYLKTLVTNHQSMKKEWYGT